MTVFDSQAAETYDGAIEDRVPGYRLMHELTAAVLLERLPDTARILVVGAGTGEEIAMLGRWAPNWRFTALDPSAGMLDSARTKLDAAGMLDRVDFAQSDMETFIAGISHDAAISLLVTQFVAHDGKAAFLSALAQALKPGAIYLSVDFHEPAAGEWALNRRWKRLRGASPAEADAMIGRMQANWHLLAGSELGRLWRKAGFAPETIYMKALSYVGTILVRHAGEPRDDL